MNHAARSLLLLLARASSIVVALAALRGGVRAIRLEEPIFRKPPARVFSSEFRAQLEAVTGRLPPGVFVLHLSATPEYWHSKLWQRALYPRNGCVVVEPPLTTERIRELATKYGARFVISAGDPAYDPGYAWKVSLGALPGSPAVSWFGELAR